MPALTDEYVLAAYVDGSDLDDVAPVLRAAFTRFAASGSWTSPQVLVVDQRQSPDLAEPRFLPQWDLGLNLGLDHHSRSSAWFAGIDALVTLLRSLADETGREFVLFLCFRSVAWRQEHLTFVDSRPVDLVRLRGFIEKLLARSG
jgi:hypothetical protein